MSYATEQGVLNAQYNAAVDAMLTITEQRRPCVLFRPSLSVDGNQWCALYGDNLQDGVAGFGDSPEAAMADFDRAWCKPLAATAEGGEKP